MNSCSLGGAAAQCRDALAVAASLLFSDWYHFTLHNATPARSNARTRTRTHTAAATCTCCGALQCMWREPRYAAVCTAMRSPYLPLLQSSTHTQTCTATVRTPRTALRTRPRSTRAACGSIQAAAADRTAYQAQSPLRRHTLAFAHLRTTAAFGCMCWCAYTSASDSDALACAQASASMRTPSNGV